MAGSGQCMHRVVSARLGFLLMHVCCRLISAYALGLGAHHAFETILRACQQRMPWLQVHIRPADAVLVGGLSLSVSDARHAMWPGTLPLSHPCEDGMLLFCWCQQDKSGPKALMAALSWPACRISPCLGVHSCCVVCSIVLLPPLSICLAGLVGRPEMQCMWVLPCSCCLLGGLHTSHNHSSVTHCCACILVCFMLGCFAHNSAR